MDSVCVQVLWQQLDMDVEAVGRVFKDFGNHFRHQVFQLLQPRHTLSLNTVIPVTCFADKKIYTFCDGNMQDVSSSILLQH